MEAAAGATIAVRRAERGGAGRKYVRMYVLYLALFTARDQGGGEGRAHVRMRDGSDLWGSRALARTGGLRFRLLVRVRAQGCVGGRMGRFH